MSYLINVSDRQNVWRSIKMFTCGSFALLMAGCNGTTNSSIGKSSSGYGSTVSPLKICSGYGCIISDRLAFTDADLEQLKIIMAPGAVNAEAERQALSDAISYMEIQSQKKLRYRPDVEFSYQKQSGKRGQMDCIDESLNTTAYLYYLQSNGLLRHHKAISTFAERGLIVDGRYPHKSARMRENGGIDWAVDSWKGPNGAKPEIMALSKWYRGRNDASQY